MRAALYISAANVTQYDASGGMVQMYQRLPARQGTYTNTLKHLYCDTRGQGSIVPAMYYKYPIFKIRQ